MDQTENLQTANSTDARCDTIHDQRIKFLFPFLLPERRFDNILCSQQNQVFVDTGIHYSTFHRYSIVKQFGKLRIFEGLTLLTVFRSNCAHSMKKEKKYTYIFSNIKTPQGWHSRSRLRSQIVLIGNRLRVNDASSVQQFGSKKLTGGMMEKAKLRSEKARRLQYKHTLAQLCPTRGPV